MAKVGLGDHCSLDLIDRPCCHRKTVTWRTALHSGSVAMVACSVVECGLMPNFFEKLEGVHILSLEGGCRRAVV